LFYGVCGQKLPSTETSVTFDGYRRRKGLTFLVEMCPEKLPNSLFFDSWSIPGPEITAGTEFDGRAGETKGATP
jgi:hypothetical protein